ncbi:MAG: hypothetical protein BIFFINMI_00896 [Phycisphaerae bacterium]|nr:hypothetical protein [Phycisphaerae bacterium]
MSRPSDRRLAAMARGALLLAAGAAMLLAPTAAPGQSTRPEAAAPKAGIIAVGDRVYVAVADHAEVLDAATGRTAKTLAVRDDPAIRGNWACPAVAGGRLGLIVRRCTGSYFKTHAGSRWTARGCT